MVDNTSQQSSDRQIAQFVRYLKEVLVKVSEPPPPVELVELHELLHNRPLKERPDPAEFYRMGDILCERKNPTMGELSQALGVPLSTATRMASWWVDNGFAERLSDPDDRRIVRLALTGRGERLLQALETHITQSVRKVLGPLTPEERDTLVSLFGKVAANLNRGEG